MCDFSLQHVKSRPAVVGEKLVVRDFGRRTRGFCPADQVDDSIEDSVAVCVMPGTEIAFDEPIRTSHFFSGEQGATYVGDQDERTYRSQLARFRQVDKNEGYMHHDALELPAGEVIKLTTLVVGQMATVLQLPKLETKQEIKDAKRLEVVG